MRLKCNIVLNDIYYSISLLRYTPMEKGNSDLLLNFNGLWGSIIVNLSQGVTCLWYYQLWWYRGNLFVLKIQDSFSLGCLRVYFCVNWSIGGLLYHLMIRGGGGCQVLKMFSLYWLLQFENVHVPLSCMDSHEQYTVDSLLPRYWLSIPLSAVVIAIAAKQSWMLISQRGEWQ